MSLQVSTVDGPSQQATPWAYSVGRVDGDLIAEHLFPAGPGTIAAMCGPPGMVNFACLPNFKKIGYTDEQCIVF